MTDVGKVVVTVAVTVAVVVFGRTRNRMMLPGVAWALATANTVATKQKILFILLIKC